ANGEDILLANIDGKIYAVTNRCGHQNVNLSGGTLQGKVVTCPLHQAKFDVTTGQCVAGPQIGFPPELMQKFPPEALEMFKGIGELVAEVESKPLKTYKVVTEGDSVKLEEL
ncbi:MAG: Rieske (2Fe-2S) protein, partial [Candidatus Bathyarchaeia archaeon]